MPPSHQTLGWEFVQYLFNIYLKFNFWNTQLICENWKKWNLNEFLVPFNFQFKLKKFSENIHRRFEDNHEKNDSMPWEYLLHNKNSFSNKWIKNQFLFFILHIKNYNKRQKKFEYNECSLMQTWTICQILVIKFYAFLM